MSPRTAERKLTSEGRCRKAFEKWISGVDSFWLTDSRILTREDWAQFGWNAAWKYLEQRVTKEFIEK